MRRTSATIDDPNRGANKADAKAMKIVADVLGRTNINDTPHGLRLRTVDLRSRQGRLRIVPDFGRHVGAQLRRSVPGLACCFSASPRIWKHGKATGRRNLSYISDL
jgi:hypothetical protein